MTDQPRSPQLQAELAPGFKDHGELADFVTVHSYWPSANAALRQAAGAVRGWWAGGTAPVVPAPRAAHPEPGRPESARPESARPEPVHSEPARPEPVCPQPARPVEDR